MSELFTSGSVGGMGRKPRLYPEIAVAEVAVHQKIDQLFLLSIYQSATAV